MLVSTTTTYRDSKQAVLVAFVVLLVLGVSPVESADPPGDDLEFFERKIRPVLVQHCYECHSAGSKALEGGLQVDFREGLRQGGDAGPAVVPGRPELSLVVKALRYETVEMPPAGKLPDEVIKDFEHWISRGAVDPRDAPLSADDANEATWKAKLAERSHWWSLQPPRLTTPPVVADIAWNQEPVDRFIRDGLAKAGLEPAPRADPEVLLRRLSFVLTGLPPTADRVRKFRRQWEANAETAYGELVEELLASPHFGERFARHWMDVVRYTDTYGYEWDIAAKGSWEYRDYLIRAFNNDIGFDQLIREQIAGDLLTSPRIDAATGLNESLIGPMFFHFGERRHGSSLEFNGVHQEMVDSQIDGFSKAFLGMTVACARCHDHKLDAVSQRDYYALAGMFMTPRWTTRSIDAPDKYDRQIAELTRLRSEIRTAMAKKWSRQAQETSWNFLALAESAKGERAWESISYPLLRLFSQFQLEPANPDGSLTIDQVMPSDERVRQRWTALAGNWQHEKTTRAAHNGSFTTLTDFSKPGLPADWVTDGAGFEHGWTSDGTPRIALEGDVAVAELLPSGYHTHALSSKLPGALRLPEPERFPAAHVSLRMNGGEWAGYRAIPQNAFLNEGPSFFAPEAGAQWLPLSRVPLKHGVTRVLTEFSTADLNANFPPRTGVARMGSVVLPHDDDGFTKRSWFSLTGAVAHEQPAAPVSELEWLEPLLSQPAPANAGELQRYLTTWLRGAVDRWCRNEPRKGDAKLLTWMLEHGMLLNEASSDPAITALVSEYRRIESTINFPRSANSFDERGVEPVDYRLNIRGDVYDEGPAVPRGYLEVFGGPAIVQGSNGSGRLELAEALASPTNPQTARVYVNRVWSWIFGKGIVSTPNDFGKLGDQPSHPELLDWLAIQFMEEGWSTKDLIRRLVLSRTFQQAGDVTAQGLQQDPGNRLWHHYPTRRLEAEAIRDSLLAVSGQLDPSLHGRPIRPHRPAEDPQKRLFSGPLDGDRRRSLYLEMSVMQPPEFLVGFNLPDLKQPNGARDVTNVPAQALILLNHPFVGAMADAWGQQVVQDSHDSPNERLTSMMLSAWGRLPTDSELRTWDTAVRDFASNPDQIMSDAAAWSTVARALFNSKEFLYYR